MSKIEKLAKKWNHGRVPDGRVYSTREVAAICSPISAQAVSKLIDRGQIEGIHYCKPHWRSSRKGVLPDALVKYMFTHGISFDRIPEDDADGQKAVLYHFIELLRQKVSVAKKQGDIFRHHGLSADKIMAVFDNSDSMRNCLGSKSDTIGCTRNYHWAKFFRLLADTIEQHTKVCKANAKKRFAGSHKVA